MFVVCLIILEEKRVGRRKNATTLIITAKYQKQLKLGLFILFRF